MCQHHGRQSKIRLKDVVISQQKSASFAMDLPGGFLQQLLSLCLRKVGGVMPTY